MVFSTSKALSTRNLYSPVKPSVADFTVRFWSGWMRAFGAKPPDKWKNNHWFLHHDYAPAHTSLFVRYFLTSRNITVIPQPYSPDLAPSDFFLFPKMKLRLKGRRFDTTEEIHAESQEIINIVTFKNFQWSMKSWETGWDCCMHAQGDYLEGDGGN